MGPRTDSINRKKIVCIVGTRPEAIKMAPVINALRNENWASVRVVATAQHRDLLDQVLDIFEISPDIDLDVMRKNQTLPELTARLTLKLDECFAKDQPDAILAQGDTTTVMVSALSAFYRKIPFGHVEAGLRTGDRYSPFPEEINRVLAGHLAQWHFAPTQSSRTNLLGEGVSDDDIIVTGNTVIDALYHIIENKRVVQPHIKPGRKLILVTAHRRENFGEPLENVLRAIKHLAGTKDDIEFLFPIHPNPQVRAMAEDKLSGIQNVTLCKPLDYLAFVGVMDAAHFLISDSGGVQEEAPALGKPVLVLRNETERPEAIEAGVVKLVGTSFDTIVDEATALLDSNARYMEMARGISPYGDGKAAQRIAKFLKAALA